MNETAKKVLLGTGAGFAGTALIRGMQTGAMKWMPETLPPMKEDPGSFMIEQAGRLLPESIRSRIPQQAKQTASRGLSFAYGTAFATAYAAMGRAQPRPFLEGTVLGLATWAAGYLGWLPAVKLLPPVWKQEAKQVAPGILSHVLFGITAVTVVKWLKRTLEH